MSYYHKHVFFCCNQRDNGKRCCNDSGAGKQRDYAKARVKALELSAKGKVCINQAGCLDRCEEGPVMVIYPGETWYTYVVPGRRRRHHRRALGSRPRRRAAEDLARNP